MTEDEIKNEFRLIHERNRKVEADKAWETSWSRRLFIGIVTYILAGIWLLMINDSYPWLKAFVPSVGYLLSTLSLPFIKNWWISGRSSSREKENKF